MRARRPSGRLARELHGHASMKIFLAVVSAVGALAGCTSSSEVTSIQGGTVAGVSFAVVDGAAMVRTSRGLTNIVLTDFADACAIADESSRPSSKQLTFLISDDVGAGSTGTPPSKPGTYTVTSLANLPASGPGAECGFAVLDATCHASTSASCDSGTVTLSRVDATGYAGTFDVVIAGAHVTGGFDVPSCSDGNSESGFGTCQ